MRQERSPIRVGVPVAVVLGNRVHALITGDKTEPPERIHFDRLTRTENELDRQVVAVAKMLREALWGMEIVAREHPLEVNIRKPNGVTVHCRGKVDIAAKESGELVYVDLKTGHLGHRAALAQMSLYAWMGLQLGEMVERVKLAICPRGGDDWHTLERKADAIAGEAAKIIDQVALSVDGALPNPGLHCDRCRNFECIFNPKFDR